MCNASNFLVPGVEETFPTFTQGGVLRKSKIALVSSQQIRFLDKAWKTVSRLSEKHVTISKTSASRAIQGQDGQSSDIRSRDE